MIEQLRIKEAIKEHGTSINEVAEKMGISRFTLSTHVNGNPSTEILLRIADAIGCPVTELFEQPKNRQSYFDLSPLWKEYQYQSRID